MSKADGCQSLIRNFAHWSVISRQQSLTTIWVQAVVYQDQTQYAGTCEKAMLASAGLMPMHAPVAIVAVMQVMDCGLAVQPASLCITLTTLFNWAC